MEFKDWLRNNSDFNNYIVEFMDVLSMSTDHINFQKKQGVESISDEEDYYSILDGSHDDDDKNLSYEFKVGSDKFKVVFEKRKNYFSRVANQYGEKTSSKSPTNLIYNSIPNLNFWSVDFYGPQGLKTTNRNKNVAIIYKNLLLSIKKLLETEKVDVLHFSPAESQMSLIYNRFYNQFLSQDFLRIGTFEFLRKKITEEIMNGDYGETIKNKISNILSTVSRQADKEFENIRSSKKKQRELLKSVPKGKIFQYETTFLSPENYSRELGVVPMMVVDSSWFQGRAFYKVVAIYNKNKTPFSANNEPNFDNYQDFVFVKNQSYEPSKLKEPNHPLILNNITKIKSLFSKFLGGVS